MLLTFPKQLLVFVKCALHNLKYSHVLICWRLRE